MTLEQIIADFEAVLNRSPKAYALTFPVNHMRALIEAVRLMREYMAVEIECERYEAFLSELDKKLEAIWKQ